VWGAGSGAGGALAVRVSGGGVASPPRLGVGGETIVAGAFRSVEITRIFRLEAEFAVSREQALFT
jgi:hypothetical protein